MEREREKRWEADLRKGGRRLLWKEKNEMDTDIDYTLKFQFDSFSCFLGMPRLVLAACLYDPLSLLTCLPSSESNHLIHIFSPPLPSVIPLHSLRFLDSIKSTHVQTFSHCLPLTEFHPKFQLDSLLVYSMVKGRERKEKECVSLV